MRIAVGIPSYLEADSIGHVVTQADRGLSALFHPADCVIVNVDGDSPDGTAEVFLETPTRCRKQSFLVREQPGGKGTNTLRFLRYCAENRVDILATIDADVKTVTPEWIDALLTPLIRGETDYVTPLYERDRFDAATTRHFAYPLIYGFFGLDIHQPIGGDFGLTGSFARYLLQQPIDRYVRGYGIDIFMSAHATGAGFRIIQSPLGRKLHKSSFPKRSRIFRDVVSTAIAVLRRYEVRTSGGASEGPLPATDGSQNFGQYTQAIALFKEMRARAADLEPIYRAWLGADLPDLTRALEADEPRISSELWTDVLAAAVSRAIWGAPPTCLRALSESLAPVFMLRAVTFWIENWRRSPLAVDEEVFAQARLFRTKLLARGQLRG